MTPLISVVIVNWNGGEYLLSAVTSVLNQDFESFECILVDNASSDNSIDPVSAAYENDSRFRLKKNTDNFGYCGGSNVGLRLAQGEYIITINPDVILAPNFLAQVAKLFLEPSIGIIAPCLTRESDPEVIDSAGTIAFTHMFATAYRAGTKLKSVETDCEVFGAIGACAIYRRKMLLEIAGIHPATKDDFFDEDFFTYYDEHDLQIRARWLGWKARYCPQLKAQHVWRHSVKSGLIKHRQLYHKAFRNYYLSMCKNMPLSTLFCSLPSLFLQEMGIIALSIIYRYPIFITAKLDALPLIPRMILKRREIMAARKISSKSFKSSLPGSFSFLGFLFGVMSSEYGDGKLISFENTLPQSKSNPLK